MVSYFVYTLFALEKISVVAQRLLCILDDVKEHSQLIFTAVRDDCCELMIRDLDCVRQAVYEQIVRGDVKFVCHEHQGVKATALVTVFDVAHVRGRSVNPLCQHHLGYAFLCSDASDPLSE